MRRVRLVEWPGLSVGHFPASQSPEALGDCLVGPGALMDQHKKWGEVGEGGNRM